jgi:DNA polymerase-3 subunit epsilon
VLPSFHEFCEDTVLIAHNAAFDMRFLQLKEERTGIKFNQPVLDTLLLSAVRIPQSGIAQAGRHSGASWHPYRQSPQCAGRSLATGEVFLKLVPLLEEKGITTIRQALEASAKTYYARVKY